MAEHEQGALHATGTEDSAAANPWAEPDLSAPPARRGARQAFRHWRRTRPFWGGLLVALGAGEMLLTYHAALKVTLHMGFYGLSGYLVPIVLGILGLSIIFDPQHRTFYSILSLLFAVASWMTTNLGGFLVGMLLAMAGASLAYGWSDAARQDAGDREEEKAPEQMPTA